MTEAHKNAATITDPDDEGATIPVILGPDVAEDMQCIED